MKYFQKSVLKMVCFLLFAIALPGTDANAQNIREETVTCEFINSQDVQTCSSKFGHCSGTESCSVFVRGVKDTKISWTSSCGSSFLWNSVSTRTTKINRNDETIQFNCKYSNNVPSKPLYSNNWVKPVAVYPSFVDVSSSSEFEDVVRAKDAPLQSDANLYFPDMDPFSLEGKAAAYLRGLGIIGGFPDGEFKGDQLVNRAELTKFLLLASTTDVGTLKNRGKFPDVLEGEWYVKYIMKAEEKGIIQGYPDGFFRPARTVNTAEALKMMTKAFSIQKNIPHSYQDVSERDWFNKYAGMAARYELFPRRENSKILQPTMLLTRNEVAIMIYKYLTFYTDESSDLNFKNIGTGNNSRWKSILDNRDHVYYGQDVNKEEALLVVNDDEVQQEVFANFGQKNVKIFSLKFIVGKNPAKISSLTFRRIGNGDVKDFDTLQLYVNNRRAPISKKIKVKEDIVMIPFQTPLHLDAHEVRHIILKADISTRAKIGNNSRFVLFLPEWIQASESIIGFFPFGGRNVEISSNTYSVPTPPPSTDQTPSWARDAVNYLVSKRVISSSEFSANKAIDLATAAKWLVKIQGFSIDTQGSGFSDLPPSHSGYKYLKTLLKLGIWDGEPSGKVLPDKATSRVEAAKLVVNGFRLVNTEGYAVSQMFRDVQPTNRYFHYVWMVYNKGLMNGFSDGTFRPQNKVTQAEFAKLLYDVEHLSSDITPPSTPKLIFKLSPQTPLQRDVLACSEEVVYTRFLVSAEGGDGKIHRLNITRLGLGDSKDFKEVWIEKHGMRITKKQPVKNAKVQLRLFAEKIIKNGTSSSFDVVASLKCSGNDKNIGHHSRFSLLGVRDISASVDDIKGQFPIEGNEVKIVDIPNQETSKLIFKLSSQTPVQRDIPICSKDVVYTKFEVMAQGEDAKLKEITVTRMGLGDSDDFEDVWIEKNGQKVTESKSFNNDDVVRLRFQPSFNIEEGNTKTFNIVADLKCVGNDTNVGHHTSFSIVDTEDINATTTNINSNNFPIEGNEVEIVDYSPVPTSTVPRISFWYGKVNQHNEDGVWKTDPDGVSGAGTQAEWGEEGWGDRPVEYCQKFWPETTSVQDFEEETITTWCDRGNQNCNYTSTRMSHECVQDPITSGI